MEDCGARTLITSAALAALASDLVALTPDVDLRLMLGPPDAGGGPPSTPPTTTSSPPSPASPWPRSSRASPMLYSSGTTGHPKGMRRPLSGLPFGTSAILAPMLGGIMGFGAGDVYLNPAPLYHSAPLVWSMTA